MPKGIPQAGFRRTRKYKAKTLQELDQEIAINAPSYAEELEKYIKPFICPHCGNEIQVVDKEVAMYMLDRALGKPRQRLEMDITETIQFNADQIDTILNRLISSPEGIEFLRLHSPVPEAIEGEYKEVK